MTAAPDARSPRRCRALRLVEDRRGSVERDCDEARAEQDKARRGQCQKSIGDEIVTTHDAPAVFPMITRLY
jgi:hypothetical protein